MVDLRLALIAIARQIQISLFLLSFFKSSRRLAIVTTFGAIKTIGTVHICQL